MLQTTTSRAAGRSPFQNYVRSPGRSSHISPLGQRAAHPRCELQQRAPRGEWRVVPERCFSSDVPLTSTDLVVLPVQLVPAGNPQLSPTESSEGSNVEICNDTNITDMGGKTPVHGAATSSQHKHLLYSNALRDD